MAVFNGFPATMLDGQTFELRVSANDPTSTVPEGTAESTFKLTFGSSSSCSANSLTQAPTTMLQDVTFRPGQDPVLMVQLIVDSMPECPLTYDLSFFNEMSGFWETYMLGVNDNVYSFVESFDFT